MNQRSESSALRGPHLLAALLALAALASACEGPAPPPSVTLFAAGDPTLRRSLPLTPGAGASLGEADLGPLAGDVGTVEYTTSGRERVYLLRGDLRGGLEAPGAALLPDLGATERQRQLTLPDTSWRSARAYDIGLCSLFLPWADLGERVARSVAAEVAPPLSLVEPEVGRLLAAPVLRVTRAAGRDLDEDRVVFTYQLTATRLRRDEPPALDCAAPLADVSVVLGVKRVPGVSELPLSCAEPDRRAGAVVLDDGAHGDLLVVVHELHAQVRGCGADDAAASDALADSLARAFPASLQRTLSTGLVFDPRALDPSGEVRACDCDLDCSARAPGGAPYPGLRHACAQTATGGECHVRLEPRRAQVRPEGLELVLIDDPLDLQADLLLSSPALGATLCDPDRGPAVPAGQPARTVGGT